MWLTDIADKHPIKCNFTKAGIVRPIHGLVLHIQEGTERGTRLWFNNPKAKASSHFGNPKLGKLEQFVDTEDRAWTQGAGNYHWLSVENEGMPGDSLTISQMVNVALLMKWLHEHENVPLTLADNPAGFGLGYHSMGGTAWGHLHCPGEPIIKQRLLILGLTIYVELSTAGPRPV